MKILVSAIMHGRSAGTWYAVETARRLLSRGHQVLYLPRPGSEALRHAKAAGLETVDDCDLEQKSPAAAYRNLRKLMRLIESYSPDVVLAHGGEDHTYWGVAKSIWARRMAVVRVRALDPKPPKRHPLALWLNRRATDMVVTANSRHFTDYQNRLRVPSHKVRIIEAGIDPAAFTALGDDAHAANKVDLPGAAPVVVMVARFAPIKGHRVFLAAAKRVKRRIPSARFLLVGYPVAYTADDLERWILEGDLVDEFTVVDRLVPQLPALLARCAVGVVASVGSETVSRSSLEYLASGIPVVATDVGGIPDLMARGAFGRVVPPDNSTRLGEAIADVLEDDAERRASGTRGRDYVMSHCTWEQRVDEWEDVLYRTVARVRGESLPRLQSGTAADAGEPERSAD